MMSLSAELRSRAEASRARQGSMTDMERIVAIPYRPLDPLGEVGAEAAKTLTDVLRRPSASVLPLRPVQGAALAECYEAGTSQVAGRGVLLPIGVGHGKTAIGEMGPTVFMMGAVGASDPEEVAGTFKALLLIPPKMRQQQARDRKVWSEHYRYEPPVVLSHAQLSMPESSVYLEDFGPDIIVLDEAHAFRHGDAARTRRLLRYIIANPDVRLIAMSGTFAARSLMDYSHLAEICLRDGSPLPLARETLELWAAAIDAEGAPDAKAYLAVKPLVDWAGSVETRAEMTGSKTTGARLAYRTRLYSTPGVVVTHDISCDASLVLDVVQPELPEEIDEALAVLGLKWELPDGEYVASGLDYTRHARTLSAGYFLRWVWPEGKPDIEWLEVRRQWFAAERSFLQFQARAGLDSPALVQRATEDGKTSKRMRDLWAAWCAIRERHGKRGSECGPPTEAVIFSSFLPDVALRWRDALVKRAGPYGKARAIIWYEAPIVGQALKEAGFDVYGRGTDSPKDSVAFPACSILVHGQGKNLQAWNQQLVLESPSSGQIWEQLLGRTHRLRQTAYEVDCSILLSARPMHVAVCKAMRDARFIEDSGGGQQRLNFATWCGERPYFENLPSHGAMEEE